MLKPAARKLSATLWERTSGVAMFEGPRAALAAASSAGRTSIAVETGLNASDCQMFGYRLCGERAVRIDIIERLADLIRAQLGATKALNQGEAKARGFAVLPQMTSMSGCSSEQFADVLRALGYESFEAPIETSKTPLAPTDETPAPDNPSIEIESLGAEPYTQEHEEATKVETERSEPAQTPEGLESETQSGIEAPPPAKILTSAESDSATSPEISSEEVGAASEASTMLPTSEDVKLVTLWRPAPRQPQVRPLKPHRVPREWTITPPSRPERHPPSERSLARVSESLPIPVAPTDNDEKSRRPRRPDAPKPQRASEAQPVRLRPMPTVDKDSPFYKLMALREQLTKK